MARSYLPVLALLALLGAAAGFFKAAVPHQEAPLLKAAAPATATWASFDEGLDNSDIVSDANITPARKCGFCMGVSVASRRVPSCLPLLWMRRSSDVSPSLSAAVRLPRVPSCPTVSRADELPRLRPLRPGHRNSSQLFGWIRARDALLG